MSGVIVQWRLYCEDERQFVTGYLPESTPCTVCFNNNTHIVNQSSASIIQTISPNTTLISTQAPNQTNGNYRREGRIMNIAAGPNVVTSQTTTFPYNIGMLAFCIDIGTQNIGDTFEALVMPRNFAPIGILEQDLISSQTVIPIPPQTISYLQMGFQLVLINHLTGFREEEQEIVKIDTINNNITLLSGITTAFNKGDYITFLMKRCKNIYINSDGLYQIGNFLRSSLFPVTMQAQLRYTNNSPTPKIFSYSSDYLF
jgi:hypothetical protein